MLKSTILTLALASCAATAATEPSTPVITGDERVDKLLTQMTLEEKLTLIHGTKEDPAYYQGEAGYLAGVPRLHIPALRFADGPPGVLTRVPSQAQTCTMGLAATFSVKDAELNGLVIGQEARANGVDVSLQPFVNIDRDLEFSRGYNTFGEDPFLTGQLAAAQIRGIQSQHVMAQVKHFVAYDSDSSNIFVDDQTLHEVYVAPFEAAVGAGVSSIMCSYNRINAAFACGNAVTLTNILREQIGFKGFITSDWGAVHSVNFINAGLDMEMPGTISTVGSSFFDSMPAAPPVLPAPGQTAAEVIALMFGGHLPEEPPPAPFNGGDFGLKLNPEKMPEALNKGIVNEAAVTRAAGRVLYQIVRFGYLDGMQKHTTSAQDIDANSRAIQKTGEDAAVLLKNDDHILPLRADDLSSVVLIGPTAGQIDSIGISGERAFGLTEREVGPLAALRKISGNSQIRFAVDNDMTGTTIPGSALSHNSKAGLERTGNAPPRVDAQLDFTSKRGNALPPNSKLEWRGTLTVEHDGDYWLYLQALGTNAAISIDGRTLGQTGALQGGLHGDILQANQDNVVPTTDGLDNVRRSVRLTAGPHAIEVRITPDSSSAPVQVRLNWYTPEQRKSDHEAAIAAAKQAKIAIVFVWARLNPVFALPGAQDQLIMEVSAVNPNTIVVLNTSQPVALPWIGRVKGVLEAWWPGDEGGWATANVILGKVSPAGRLPVTWGKRLADYAATDPSHPERSSKGVDGKTTYSEGVNVGYRWFDKQHIDPLFPFGHGLSYTTFEYSGMKLGKTAAGGLDVTVEIKNTGPVGSDEVPQVYLDAPRDIPAGAQFPVRALGAFNRMHIPARTSKTVTLHVPPRQFQYWSTAQQKWITAAGPRTISIGASSRDLRLSQAIDLTQPSAAPR